MLLNQCNNYSSIPLVTHQCLGCTCLLTCFTELKESEEEERGLCLRSCTPICVCTFLQCVSVHEHVHVLYCMCTYVGQSLASFDHCYMCIRN